MIVSKIIVSALCLTAAAWIAVRKIRKIAKEEKAKGYHYVSLCDYEKGLYYDIWYSAGFIAIALLYDIAQPCTDASGWFSIFFIPSICFVFARFGKHLDAWEMRQSKRDAECRKFAIKTKQLSRVRTVL